MTDIVELFNNMLADPMIEVQEFARRAQELKLQFSNKELSEDEYNELVEDLLNLEYINKEMLSLDVQKKLDTTITVLKNLKFFVTFI
jgi:hypothetical protein